MTTLQDVAKKAGVSTATVSKVLSNTPYFTEDTREKVMRAVQELDYRPNLAARALSTGKRTHIIAVVFPYIYDALFTDPLTLRILEGIEAESTQQGYNLLLSTPRLTADGPDERYLELIDSGYIEGVIALDNVPMASVLEPVHKRGLPCVGLGYHQTSYSVHSDDFSGGVRLMQHVIELGHRHIGIVTVPEDMNFALNHRFAGLRAAAEAAGLDFDRLPVACGDFSMPGGAVAVSELLEVSPDLTAVVCLNDRMALGAIRQARALGRRIPEDLTVVGYDNIPMSAFFDPPLTTIDQQALEQGRTAIRMLFDVLDSKSPTPVIIPTHLIVGRSSAAPRLRES